MRSPTVAFLRELGVPNAAFLTSTLAERFWMAVPLTLEFMFPKMSAFEMQNEERREKKR